jgi:hypothetical protein
MILWSTVEKGEAMLRKLIFAFAISMSAYAPTVSHAQQLIGSYVALLSEADHFNSKGQRLTWAAADDGNRAALEQMLERGRADPGVLSRIVNGTPVIRVDIYRGADGPFVRVTLLD